MSKKKQVEPNYALLLLYPSPSLTVPFNQFNNTRPEVNDDTDNVVNSKYYSINEIQLLQANKNKSLSMFHINTCSLNINFDGFEYLLKSTNKQFDVVAITETIITGNISSLHNINLKNYAIESTLTESLAEGALLYIANLLSYKPHQNLNMFRNPELESIFVEIINSKNSSILVGIIYRHPSMIVTDFNNYLNTLLNIYFFLVILISVC